MEYLNLIVVKNKICGPCQVGKQIRTSHKNTFHILTKRCLELLHIDIMGPFKTESLDGKRYILVVVDDYSSFTWINLLRDKYEIFDHVRSLCKRIQNEKSSFIIMIRSDHGKEFENSFFENFCLEEGIHQEFSAPITP